MNSGSMDLAPQEIRRCMYDSAFYDSLYKTNTQVKWRRLVGGGRSDLHMKDVEILLRGFAMLIKGDSYSPSMERFLNAFSETARLFDDGTVSSLSDLLQSFLDSCDNLPDDAFQVGGRFSAMIFESVFVASCAEAYSSGTLVKGTINPDRLRRLRMDQEFYGRHPKPDHSYGTSTHPSVASPQNPPFRLTDDWWEPGGHSWPIGGRT